MGFGRDFVVGWGTLALINAGLAQSKGKTRSGTATGAAALRLPNLVSVP